MSDTCPHCGGTGRKRPDAVLESTRESLAEQSRPAMLRSLQDTPPPAMLRSLQDTPPPATLRSLQDTPPPATLRTTRDTPPPGPVLESTRERLAEQSADES